MRPFVACLRSPPCYARCHTTRASPKSKTTPNGSSHSSTRSLGRPTVGLIAYPTQAQKTLIRWGERDERSPAEDNATNRLTCVSLVPVGFLLKAGNIVLRDRMRTTSICCRWRTRRTRVVGLGVFETSAAEAGGLHVFTLLVRLAGPAGIGSRKRCGSSGSHDERSGENKGRDP